MPVIRVRDKDTGRVHVVGSNTHDMLIISDGIQYVNMQSCGSTMSGEYEFVAAWEDPFEGEIACRWYSPSRIQRISDRLAKWRKQFDKRVAKILFGHDQKKKSK